MSPPVAWRRGTRLVFPSGMRSSISAVAMTCWSAPVPALRITNSSVPTTVPPERMRNVPWSTTTPWPERGSGARSAAGTPSTTRVPRPRVRARKEGLEKRRPARIEGNIREVGMMAPVDPGSLGHGRRMGSSGRERKTHPAGSPDPYAIFLADTLLRAALVPRVRAGVAGGPEVSSGPGYRRREVAAILSRGRGGSPAGRVRTFAGRPGLSGRSPGPSPNAAPRSSCPGFLLLLLCAT